MSDLLFHAIRRNSYLQDGAELTAATLAVGLMFYVEIFDGYSGDHGFSREDMTMDLLGAGFSILRNSVPGLRETLDFRMEYQPSGYKGFDPLADYAGQKYLFALKLAGFEAIRESPLRFVELNAGYYSRGFTKEERALGLDKERNLYFGVGLNLQELPFGAPAIKSSGVRCWSTSRCPIRRSMQNMGSMASDFPELRIGGAMVRRHQELLRGDRRGLMSRGDTQVTQPQQFISSAGLLVTHLYCSRRCGIWIAVAPI
jgi:Predicted periplasmic lipoprotein (DUF2279)